LNRDRPDENRLAFHVPAILSSYSVNKTDTSRSATQRNITSISFISRLNTLDYTKFRG